MPGRFTCLVAIAAATAGWPGQHAAAEIRYRVKPLAALPGTTQPQARGVNDSGIVVGTATDVGQFGFRALVWVSPDRQPIMITGFGDDACGAESINAAGEVIGTTSEGLAGFRWTSGGDLIPLVSFTTNCCGSARAINDDGLIVGVSTIMNGANRAARWLNDEIVDLGVLPGDCCSTAYDVSNSGIAAGESGLRAVRWVDGAIEDLGTLGGIALGLGVNDAGDVVGWSVDATGFSKPFVWRGAMQPLPLPGPATYGQAEAIGNEGLIVGECHGPDGFSRATLWRDDVPIDINDRLVDAPGDLIVRTMFDISDAGYVAANGTIGGVWTAMRLDPVPPWDVVADGVVNTSDFLAVLTAWGACPPAALCAADVDANGVVGVSDLLEVLSHWG